MKSRYVLIVGAVAYFAFFQGGTPAPGQKGFAEQYFELQGVWKARGVGSVVLHSSVEEVAKLSDAELGFLESDLEEFASTADSAAISAVADAYSRFVAGVRGKNRVQAIVVDLAASDSSACDNLQLYESLLSEEKEFGTAVNSYVLKANEFVEAYPAEAESIALVKGEATGQLGEGVAEIEGSVIELREVCK